MNTYANKFFNELAKMSTAIDPNVESSENIAPNDGDILKISDLQHNSMISNEIIEFINDFVNALTERSEGRYQFEMDFKVAYCRLWSCNYGRTGRKQLYIGFDSVSPDPHPDWRIYPDSCGATIGLAFDLHNKYGIIPKCVNDYGKFYEKVYLEPELFDATFAKLGGHAESRCNTYNIPITSEDFFSNMPDILERWYILGRRISVYDFSEFGSLTGFVDECINVFDEICFNGFYDLEKEDD